MPIVPAKCPNCAANLEVNSSQDAAICTHCGTPFIVEKAITNYQISNQILLIFLSVLSTVRIPTMLMILYVNLIIHQALEFFQNVFCIFYNLCIVRFSQFQEEVLFCFQFLSDLPLPCVFRLIFRN